MKKVLLFLILVLLPACGPPTLPDGKYTVKLEPLVSLEYTKQLATINKQLVQLTDQLEQQATVVPKNLPEKNHSLPTLHAFIVVDNTDKIIGQSVLVDLQTIQSELKKIAKESGLTLDERLIKGPGLSAARVKNAINTALIDNSDVVIFYYSGHGVSNSSSLSQWPELFLHGGFLPLDNVLSLLQKKSPRFMLVIVDACNNISDATTTHRASVRLPDNTRYAHLFRRYKGTVIVTGSKKGGLAWGNNFSGGYFSDVLFTAMRGDYKTWKELILRVMRPIAIDGHSGFQYPYSEVNVRAID